MALGHWLAFGINKKQKTYIPISYHVQKYYTLQTIKAKVKHNLKISLV